jgi:hypothetical protein
LGNVPFWVGSAEKQPQDALLGRDPNLGRSGRRCLRARSASCGDRAQDGAGHRERVPRCRRRRRRRSHSSCFPTIGSARAGRRLRRVRRSGTAPCRHFDEDSPRRGGPSSISSTDHGPPRSHEMAACVFIVAPPPLAGETGKPCMPFTGCRVQFLDTTPADCATAWPGEHPLWVSLRNFARHPPRRSPPRRPVRDTA